jgi:aryl-alcohol dehydrogenase-like predicted oxidoreductase
MKNTRLKGFNISALTLGTVQLGLDYSLNSDKPTLTQSLDILGCATEQGISVLDTAREYGNSEEVIGSFLKEKPDSLVVSKFKIDPGRFDGTEAAWEAAYVSVSTSLQALGLSKIPILLFHKTPAHDLAATRKLIPALLERFKKKGLIETGGISVVEATEIPHFMDCPGVEAFQVPINIFDHRLLRAEILQELSAAGKILFARSIFLKGLFFRSPETLKDHLPEAIPFLKALHRISTRSGIGIAELAFAFVRDIPEISSIVFGADNPEQVRQNVGLLGCPVLPPAVRTEIMTAFESVPKKVITPHLWTI